MSITLPKGANPRGERPYVFVGDYFGEPVPGAIVKPGRVICTVDCAWIFEAAGLRLVRAPLGNQHIHTMTGHRIAGLYDYQSDGVWFLANRDYALLADEMGLGKTVQALCAAELRAGQTIPRGHHAVLILCPAIAKRHWAREVKRWTGHDAYILDGVKAHSISGYRYFIANYDILYGIRRRDAAGKLNEKEGLGGWGKHLASMRFPIVICDEAHNLRGEKSRRTQAVKAVAEHSTCVWMLTGTPMPNRTRDIWSLWDLASDGLCGWFWPFAKAYCGYQKTIYGSTADGASRQEELGKRLWFWCLGRTKNGVGLQLPEKRREVVTVDVKAEAPEVWNLFPGDRAAHGKSAVVESELRRTARAKRPAVVEMAREAVDAKQKVIVFTYLREQAEAIWKELTPDRVAFCATGDQTPEQRDQLAQSFREADYPCAFVATLDSVGVAISLVGADLMIFADLSYDPSKLLQGEARGHRIGSRHPLLVRYVIAAGTLDEAVAETVVDKLDTIASAIGGIADGAELSGQLRRGEVVTTEAIIDRLFQRLTGGK